MLFRSMKYREKDDREGRLLFRTIMRPTMSKTMVPRRVPIVGAFDGELLQSHLNKYTR